MVHVLTEVMCVMCLLRCALLATCPRRRFGAALFWPHAPVEASAPCAVLCWPHAPGGASEVLPLEQARIALRRLHLGQVARLQGGGGADGVFNVFR